MSVICEIDAGLLSEVFRENKVLKEKVKIVTDKVEFYSKLDSKTEYEKGFNRAFEMCLSFLKEM